MKKGIWVVIILILLYALVASPAKEIITQTTEPIKAPAALRLLMSDDLQAMEPILTEYVAQSGEHAEIAVSYEGIASIRSILQSDDCPYDAVWISSSVHFNMLDGGQRLSHTEFSSASPVVFAVRQPAAQSLGLTGELTVLDLIDAIGSGKLSFVIPNVSQTNSGLTAYLGLLSGLSGNPTVLTQSHLQNPELQSGLISLFSAVERSSGSDAFVMELLENEAYDCTVSSEAELIRLNERLEAAGKAPMQLLYPAGGVTMNDYPLAYIDQGDADKLSAFLDFQSFVMGAEGRDILTKLGFRTDFGGLIAPEHYSIFKEDWGIKTKEYISSIVYPRKEFVTEALSIYLNLLKKPSFTVFSLDFSGSMWGTGHEQLMAAMAYILDPEEAGKDLIQFTDKDRVAIVIFHSGTQVIASGSGEETLDMLSLLEQYEPDGGTAMHRGIINALTQIDVDPAEYTLSIVNMTDGEASQDSEGQKAVEQFYRETGDIVPVYSIMFGDASDKQLVPLAEISGGKVFDGRTDLTKAFQEVRGYN